MLRKILLFILVISVYIYCDISAQNDLPRLSPKAFVGQTIGYTEVVISYGSPGVRTGKYSVPWSLMMKSGAQELMKQQL
jgi:hypothetical protein